MPAVSALAASPVGVSRKPWQIQPPFQEGNFPVNLNVEQTTAEKVLPPLETCRASTGVQLAFGV